MQLFASQTNHPIICSLLLSTWLSQMSVAALLGSAHLHRRPSTPQPTTTSTWLRNSAPPPKRQAISSTTACGYDNGDPTKGRSAATGFACFTDTVYGLWGFCPTQLLPTTDCGLVALCVDSHSCTAGCGKTIDRTEFVTTTWYVIATGCHRHQRKCNRERTPY